MEQHREEKCRSDIERVRVGIWRNYGLEYGQRYRSEVDEKSGSEEDQKNWSE